MNPTEAKFHDDLDTISTQLHLGVQSGKYTWKQVQERLKAKASAVGSTTDRYLHEYTWTSLAMVAGLGALLGFALGRR